MNDLSNKKELADAARDLLDNKAFAQAILELRKRLFEELLGCQADQLIEFRAQIKALESIPAELTILMNNYKMAIRQQRNG
jgi:hypothetical protein